MSKPFGLKLAGLFGLETSFEVREFLGSTKQTAGKLLIITPDYAKAQAVYSRRVTANADVELRAVIRLARWQGLGSLRRQVLKEGRKGPDLPDPAAGASAPTHQTSE